MLQHELRTERLNLIPVSARHLEHQIELDTDPEVMRFLGGTRSRKACEKELAEFLAEAVRGLGYWAGFVGDEFAGYWILRVPDLSESVEGQPNEGIGELGYRLLPRYWRRGLGSEGSRELLRYGFEDLGLGKIVAFTAAKNAASRAMMASVGMGFVREFEVDAAGWPEGTDLHGVEYAISAKDWSLRR